MSVSCEMSSDFTRIKPLSFVYFFIDNEFLCLTIRLLIINLGNNYGYKVCIKGRSLSI